MELDECEETTLHDVNIEDFDQKATNFTKYYETKPDVKVFEQDMLQVSMFTHDHNMYTDMSNSMPKLHEGVLLCTSRFVGTGDRGVALAGTVGCHAKSTVQGIS